MPTSCLLRLLLPVLGLFAAAAPLQAAVIIDTFSATPGTAVLNPGESNDSTGLLAVGSGALGNQRNLVVAVTGAAMPAGQSATLEVDSGPALLQIAHSATASRTRYQTSMSDSSWAGTPYDLAGALGATLPSEISFEVEFLGAVLGGSSQNFVMDVATNGGFYQYAGAITSPGAQTLTLTYLTASGTPDINEVLGFNLIAEILAGTGTASNFTITEVRAIPEPSVALLGGVGAILLLRRRRAA